MRNVENARIPNRMQPFNQFDFLFTLMHCIRELICCNNNERKKIIREWKKMWQRELKRKRNAILHILNSHRNLPAKYNRVFEYAFDGN